MARPLRVDVEGGWYHVMARGAERRLIFPGKAYGGHGRNLVLYLARMHSGLTLREIGEEAGGIEYKTVGKAVKRFEQIMQKDRTIRSLAKRCLSRMATFEWLLKKS